jgi:hypothetical protein
MTEQTNETNETNANEEVEARLHGNFDPRDGLKHQAVVFMYDQGINLLRHVQEVFNDAVGDRFNTVAHRTVRSITGAPQSAGLYVSYDDCKKNASGESPVMFRFTIEMLGDETGDYGTLRVDGMATVVKVEDLTEEYLITKVDELLKPSLEEAIARSRVHTCWDCFNGNGVGGCAFMEACQRFENWSPQGKVVEKNLLVNAQSLLREVHGADNLDYINERVNKALDLLSKALS